MRLSRLSLYGLVSTTLFVSTVVNAFRGRSNFYAAAVYLSKSNACMMILWNQGIYQTLLFGKLLQAVFLGELRLIEVERLQERGWFAVTETLLALTIFKDDFESSFVMLFVSLLFLKVFHWLASDRVEMMEQAAQVSRLAHVRLVGLLSLLWLADILLLIFAVDSILLDGPTVMIMFASEYMILLANVWNVTAKYAINVVDMRRQEPWEEKSIYVFYVELAADFFKLVTYLAFFGLILTFYGLPLNILRDVYITLRSFLLKIRDLRRYRQATRNMDTLYPDATREEMERMTDRTCIICREDMEYRPAPGEAPLEGQGQAEGEEGEVQVQDQAPAPRGPNDTPKKLPCGHVFHFHCLRSWLERQQSCPTCRRPVLPQEQPLPPAGGAPPQPAPPADVDAPARPAGAADGAAPPANAPRDPGEEAIRQAQINLARNLGREAFGVLFPGIPFPPEAEGAGPAGGRLPQPPAAGGPTLAPPPIPPHQLQDPQAVPPPSPAAWSSAAGAQPAPTPTTSQTGSPSPASPAAAPSTAAAPAEAAENPLARFSLPNLPVPSTGEAGLYHAPPSFAYPSASSSFSSPSSAPAASSSTHFSNLAYGAYPQFPSGGPAGGLPPPPAGSVQASAMRGVRNVEEKVRGIRERWEADRAERAAREGEGGGESRAEEREGKGKGRAVEPEEKEQDEVEKKQGEQKGDDDGASPRDAALRAAEKRAGKRPERPSTLERPPITQNGSSETVVPSSPLAATAAAQEGSSTSSARPASASLTDGAASPAGPVALPRLIPLFDISNPTSASTLSLAYPSLFPPSSPGSTSFAPAPLIPPASTAAQLSEADRLARAALEERLRVLVGFQQRMEGLVGEMKAAIGGTGEAALASAADRAQVTRKVTAGEGSAGKEGAADRDLGRGEKAEEISAS
ncbi:hypothetical protein JCM10207_006610 [Rhodosporidiobolus poonsookiae]